MNALVPPKLPSRQRGLASLIIVALLFFVVTLVAAYTNRNLIFEQRTSANQYRSTLAIDAAEAGVEWALALLNGGRIDADCLPSSDAGDTTFRDRYLVVDEGTGVVTLSAAGEAVHPTCVFDGDDWVCQCPAEGATDLDEPAGGGLSPAFSLRFVAAPTNTAGQPVPGAVMLEVNACTRLLDDCLAFPSLAASGEGRAQLRVLLALRGGIAAPPSAAITVRGSLDVAAAALGAYNNDAALGGVAIQAGGTISGSALRLGGAPGLPADLLAAQVLVPNDPGLAALADVDDFTAGERLFGSLFAVRAATWRDQPGVVRLECGGACDADAVRDAIADRPAHAVWVEGDLVLDGGGDIGSAAQPVLIVATGDITVQGLTVYGLLYSRSAAWASAGDGTVVGAAVAENDFGGDATFTVSHDTEILNRLRWRTGSFVRAPGGWRDF